ncbi:MAG: hypothetical protein WCQ26_06100 [Pseudanabaena sp. ELA748]
MSSFNCITKRVRKDLERLYQLESESEVDFRIVAPTIRKKYEYFKTEFQELYIAYRNEKARGTI